MRPDPVLTARLACKDEIEKAIKHCHELGQKSMLLEHQQDQAEHDFVDRDMDPHGKTSPGTPRAIKESKKFKAPT